MLQFLLRSARVRKGWWRSNGAEKQIERLEGRWKRLNDAGGSDQGIATFTCRFPDLGWEPWSQ